MMTILNNRHTHCPIKAISGRYTKDRTCYKDTANREAIWKSCGKCIEKWLNEESE